MKTVIFLGAGASAAEGAPLQKDLLRNYFKKIRSQRVHDTMGKALKKYLRLVFNLDCETIDLDVTDFPTFEEALGVIDLALARNESIKGIHNMDLGRNGPDLALIRHYLVFLLTDVIEANLRSYLDLHSTLVENLSSLGLLLDTSFISTNYDILIDNALVKPYPSISLDYGIDFANFCEPDDWTRPHDPRVHLLKIHGSLNWLFCSTCNTVTLTPKEKRAATLITKNAAPCKHCGTAFSPIIVPPTFYKDMSNVYLQTIWNKAEGLLREAGHVIFCGYSFPDADMHIKYLLKRSQTNRQTPIRYTVVNNHNGKSNDIETLEKKRYARFLGPANYTRLSFRDFAKAPRKLMKPARHPSQ